MNRTPGNRTARAAATLLASTALILALLGSTWPAPVAAAPARFVLEKCDWELPGGGVEGAVFHGAPPFTGAQNCAERGGSIFVVQQGDVGTSSAYWSLPLPAPPGGYTESVTVTGSMCNGAFADAGTVAFAVQGGWALNCQAQTHTFSVNSPAGSAGLVYVGCEGECRGAPEAWAGGFAATEVDPVPPQVQSLGGTLLAGGPLHGHQSIDAVASDEGGGVSSLTLRVDGQPLEPVQELGCSSVRVANPSYVGVVATRPTPCPAKAETSWTVDTAGYPFREGANSVSVCAQDFATLGTPNEGCLTQRVDVDNSCAESQVVGGEVLNARFERSGSDQITVPYGRGAEVKGRLSDEAGDPIAGATVCVEPRTQGSRGPAHATATTTTDAAGRFTYKLTAGPNRRVLLGYRHDAFQVGRTISYHARARPRLHLSPERIEAGGRVRITGKLPGPRAAGRVVVLQASALHGRRWLTFHRATTGPRGHFAAGYRFGSTTHTVSYRIRALVPRQRGYPYQPGHSRSVRVTVRR